MLAQTQHFNHEPQTTWNMLLSKELRHGDLFRHCELLIGVREALAFLAQCCGYAVY